MYSPLSTTDQCMAEFLDCLPTSHGYRGVDTSHNLWLLPSGELLYFVATVAVLHNRRSDTQRHYTDHTEDIQRWVWTYRGHTVADVQVLYVLRT